MLALERAFEDAPSLELERFEAPAASREQLERVHTAEHVSAIEAISERGGGMIDVDTVASEDSWEAALHAAGGAASAARALLSNQAPQQRRGSATPRMGGGSAFCALRPPGHHAERARAMGFCLFNNVAIAAAEAIAEGLASRVLVLDWDVHHGNGTEEIFAASRDVLYASIHQWPLYPGTGPAEYAGEGDGQGFTLNLPVPPGAGPEEFLALVQHVILPAARAFEPELIAISAGYDAHRDDPLASCMLDAGCYADMAASVRRLAAELDAPVLVCLEGGYAPAALAESVVATIAALDGDREPRTADPAAAEPHLSRWRERGPA